MGILYSELRIGNCLLFQGSKAELFGINKDCIIQYQQENDVFHCGIDEIKPIELTEEILLKLEGIVKLNEFQYKLNDLFLIEIDVISKNNYSIRKVISEESSVFICFMEHLHQLQNIYYDLCNEELNVKL